MGVGVSGWPLARAVSQRGQLGVVSGTGLAILLARRLNSGDVGGHLRRALAQFPVPAMAQRVLERYFVEGGKPPEQPYPPTERPQIQFSQGFIDLTVLANFAEVWLAKEGHEGVVGINYLEKMQIPTLPSLLGAMLAGVDYVLMGAGIPRFIPGVLDAFAEGRAAELRIDVEGAAAGESFVTRLDPAAVLGMKLPLRRPRFLAVIASAVLAATLARKSNGRVDGFVVEGPTAGGHNAPPRGVLQLSPQGAPVYGERDQVDLGALRKLELPFWLAGGYAHPQRLQEAMAAGAAGIQVGTAFAFCNESSTRSDIKRRAIQMSREGNVHVFTDPHASPTGFPFKVMQMQGTQSQADVYGRRQRVCDLGYLRQPYRQADGSVGYRCSAEPVDAYVAKGGDAEATPGRQCLCNTLFATIGFGQLRAGGEAESPVVTAGDDAAHLTRFIPAGQDCYSAADVIAYLLGNVEAAGSHGAV
jgi:NAD(P)H-dependent flavin oxidoreductase YrpB (nitropropane dioxygenase family)